MVVKHDHGCGARHQRLAVDLTRIGHTRVERPDRNEPDGDQSMARVQEQHAESLDGVCAELRQKVRGDVARAEKLRSGRRSRQERSPAELDGRLYPARLNGADAGYVRQSLAMETREAVRAPGQRKNLVGERERARACRAVTDEHEPAARCRRARRHRSVPAFPSADRVAPDQSLLYFSCECVGVLSVRSPLRPSSLPARNLPPRNTIKP